MLDLEVGIHRIRDYEAACKSRTSGASYFMRPGDVLVSNLATDDCEIQEMVIRRDDVIEFSNRIFEASRA